MERTEIIDKRTDLEVQQTENWVEWTEIANEQTNSGLFAYFL